MTTQIYNPTAISKDGKICLKYWEYDAPNKDYFLEYGGDIDTLSFNNARYKWTSSAKVVEFKDQMLFKSIIWNVYLNDDMLDYVTYENALHVGFSLHSIAHRIKVISSCCGRCDCINDECDNNGRMVAIIEEEEVQDKLYTQDQMIQAAKYGYEFHQTTQFPDHNFEDACINNFKQWLITIKP